MKKVIFFILAFSVFTSSAQNLNDSLVFDESEELNEIVHLIKTKKP